MAEIVKISLLKKILQVLMISINRSYLEFVIKSPLSCKWLYRVNLMAKRYFIKFSLGMSK